MNNPTETTRSQSPLLSSGANLPKDQDVDPTPETNSSSDILNETTDDDGKTCPICFAEWTSAGDHRISSLKCGHVFGHSCVLRWLNLSNKGDKCCPVCKAKAKYSDVRCLYARRLVAVDNSEVEAIKKEVHAAVSEKNRIQVELTKVQCREHTLVRQVKELKGRIDALERKFIGYSNSYMYYRHHTFQFSLLQRFVCFKTDIH